MVDDENSIHLLCGMFFFWSGSVVPFFLFQVLEILFVGRWDRWDVSQI